MHSRFFVLGAALLALGSACSDTPTFPMSGLAITTDQASYQLAQSSGAAVTVTLRNASVTTVRLSTCGAVIAPLLERLDAGRWVVDSHDQCVNVAYQPFDLVPNAALDVRVNPQVLGTYRVRAPLFAGEASQDFSRETSTVFEVR
jgi:hypothetical protein